MATELPDGVRLLRTLTGQGGKIGRIGWSPDGHLLATPSTDGTVRIWNTDSGACLCTIRGQGEFMCAAIFDLNGRILVTGGSNGISLWDVDSGRLRNRLASDSCYAVAFSSHSHIAASMNESGVVTIRVLPTGSMLCRIITGDTEFAFDVTFDGEGGMLATGNHTDGTVRLWAIPSGERLRALDGNSGLVTSVAFHPGGGILASASIDHTVRLWDVATGGTVSILEGHTRSVMALSFSGDGRMLASKSTDGTVRLWETKSGRCTAVLSSFFWKYWTQTITFHPHLPILAEVGLDSDPGGDSVVHLWKLDVDHLLAHAATLSVSYTTAKIVLVGESGVGKTGLGWRLAHGEFVEHASTHGQQFWLLDELGGTAADGTRREAILWDLAGQPDYRLIRALYLDDTDLALVLFDPMHWEDPLRGVEYWLRQLGRQRPIILVATRSDRGAPWLTAEEIKAFCTERGLVGYVATSALRGDGLDELVGRMRTAIRWDKRPTTVTTQTFKRIKDYVLGLKEKPSPEKAILSPAELRARLGQEYPTIEFTSDELLTAVGHLSNHGYLAQLHTWRGEPRILLAPELLKNLAASIVLEARHNPNGLGSLDEQQVLADEYHFPELAQLSAEEREVLLDLVIVRFLENSVCFRATDRLATRSYLVFPQLINFKKPVIDDEQPFDEGAAYTVIGAVENVYASLVVLLGYTNQFARTDQWRDHARYVTGDGSVCDLRKEAEREGELDFVLSFGATVETSIRTLFQSLFEYFLGRPELTVRHYQAVWCISGHQIHRDVMRRRLTRGADYVCCEECGQRVALPTADTPIELTRAQAADRDTQRQVADRRLWFEQALYRLQTYVKQAGIPTPDCFISYAWGEARHERWVEHELAADLRKAGITVVLDRWNATIGTSIPRFAERIARVQKVIVVGTPLYRAKYENNQPMGAFVVAAEGDLIGNRMIGSEADKENVLPVLLDGTSESSFPPLLRGRVYADFRPPQQYLPTVLELIASLYQLSSDEL